MRAVVARAFGPPQSFMIEDLGSRSPGEGEVSVAIQVAGVSLVDSLIGAGHYQIQPPLPFTPGSEFAGTVAAVGRGVTAIQPGDRVCGATLHGAFAERITLAARSVTRIPDAMPLRQAAVFRVSFSTAYHALVQRGRLARGEVVLVLGASGAIGSAAVQIAKALGAFVVAHASTDTKRQFALECGADAVIDTSSDNWRNRLAAVTIGRQADVVIDPVGGIASARAFRSLAYNGRHLAIGFASGAIADLPLNLPIMKGAAAIGVNIYEFGRREPQASADNLARLFELYEARSLRPIVGASFTLDSFADAMQAVSDGTIRGRAVLNITGSRGESGP